MDTMRYALRRLLRAPGFVTIAVVSLALGIGAATAMFTLTDALLLRPLSVREPSRLVRLSAILVDGRVWRIHTPAVDLLQQDALFDGACGFLAPGATAEIGDTTAPANTLVLTGGCFETLGIRPALGRLLTPEDDRPGAARVVVLSYDEWERRFHRDPSVLGHVIRLEGTPFTVIGVTEPGFTGLQRGFPTALFHAFTDRALISGQGPMIPREALQVEIVGRMRPGVTIAAVEARMRAVWPRLLEAVTPPGLTGVHLENYRRRQLRVAEGARGVDDILRPRFERPLIALLAVSGIVLLLVCVNLASLLLARGAEQRREWLVQLALGAPRSVLVRGVLAEGGLVLALGAVGGVALAFWISRLLVAIYGESMVQFAIDVVPDLRILGFAVATSALVMLTFAIGPAWSASRLSVSSLNAESSRLVPSRGRVRAAAIVVQIGLAIVLASLGALCISTLREMKTAPLGMTVEGIAAAQLAGRSGGYQNGFSGTPYYQDLLRRINGLPGVRRSALSQPFVLSGFNFGTPVSRPGGDGGVESVVASISDDFFATLEIPMLIGTPFERDPRPTDPRTVIVSESLARGLFGAEPPLGRLVRVGLDPQEAPARIVAVVRDAIVVSPQQRNTRVAYLNYWQLEPARQGFPSLLARVDGQAGPVLHAIERTVRDAGLEYVLKAATLEEVRDGSLAQERLLASLTTAFAVVGLVLVAVGVYGLLAFSVVQRTAEIGLRVALGGTPRAVVWLVVRDTMYLVLGGIAIGVPAGVLATQTLGSLVFTAPLGSGRHAATAVAVLLVFCLAAVWLPSRRASRIEPADALRRS